MSKSKIDPATVPLRIYKVGLMAYEAGEELGRDYDVEGAKEAFARAYHSFIGAARMGVAGAAAHLGLMYMKGYVPDDSNSDYNEGRAIIWFARAIAMGDPIPQEALDNLLDGCTLAELGIEDQITDFITALTSNDGLIPYDTFIQLIDGDEAQAMAPYMPAGTAGPAGGAYSDESESGTPSTVELNLGGYQNNTQIDEAVPGFVLDMGYYASNPGEGGFMMKYEFQ